MKNRLIVTKENSKGRNVEFLDKKTGESLTRAAVVKGINTGKYADYHVRMINGLATPVSNPNGSSSDNLG
jgi:hypothetical protein